MKKYVLVILFILFSVSTAYSLTTQQTTAQDAARQQKMHAIGQEGCQKALGFFPTPSKIMCVLAAIGKSEKEVKPKAIAIIFTVCQGHAMQAQTSTPLKKYATLGACLSDTAAVDQMNKELSAQGFPIIKVVNPMVLTSGAKK